MKYKDKLNELQKLVFQSFKPLGFKQKDRTFNKEAEKGIYQVINFQSGQFPIGQNYEIPGFRENYYGKFTVNLGVCVKELDEINFPNKAKSFYQEYDCQIRTRLSHLIYGKDVWWNLDGSVEEIAKEIDKGLKLKGASWFELFESREKICRNFGDEKTSYSPKAKLDVAMIVLQKDKVEGEKLFREYFNTLEQDRAGHREYVLRLAKRFGLNIS